MRALTILISSILLGAVAVSAQDLPKNIVLIMADDIGIEGFGCYGGTSYQDASH